MEADCSGAVNSGVEDVHKVVLSWHLHLVLSTEIGDFDMVLADFLTKNLPLLITSNFVVEADSKFFSELGIPPSNDGVLLLFVIVSDVKAAV